MIIDVWSDVVCPWCFIGKRRLEKALSTFAHKDEVIIRHRAFQLQPDIKTTVPTSALLSEKYNLNPSAVKEMQANVCAIPILLTMPRVPTFGDMSSICFGTCFVVFFLQN